jgi:hypothetical protein
MILFCNEAKNAGGADLNPWTLNPIIKELE